MANFLLDNNMQQRLAGALFTLPAGHVVVTARQWGLEQATDSTLLHAAAHAGYIVLTHDSGFDCLDEAWAEWIASARHSPRHSGIVQVTTYGHDHISVARVLDIALPRL